MNKLRSTKLYYSISEVAEITNLQPYTLRAWEREFSCLRPRRNRGKNRAYRERDIGVILLIKQLLYDERYTTQGVRKKLKAEPKLLQQIGSQMPLLVKRAKSEVVNQSETPHTTTKVGKDVDKEQFRAVVEDVKRELRDIVKQL